MDPEEEETKPTAFAPTDLGPKAVIGRFRLVAALGAGGMADVYRAHDTALDRAVALKVLRKTGALDDPDQRRRVLREARAAAALTHPNTVTIFDVGEADGEVFIAMELLVGHTLRVANAQPEVTLEHKLKWLLQAARALEAAHERGLVHRDVKPDNMFVCADGTLKLLDFGIAKRDEDDAHAGGPISEPPSSIRTAAGRRVGTPRYMAPEQHHGRATDARTDEYAWGLVAFEILTGGHAVAAAATVSMKDANAPAEGVARGRLADLRAKEPDLPDVVGAAVIRALESEMDARFPSMAPIIAALEQPAPRARRPRPRWLAAGVVALAALAAAAGVRQFADARVAAPPTSCRVAPVRSVPLAADDRAAALPTGELVTLRDFRKGISLARETPSGPVPFAATPFLEAIGTDYVDVSLRGMSVAGAPAAVAFVDQGPIGGALVLTLSDSGHSSRRVPPPIAGIVAAPFGKGVVLGVTTLPAESRFMNLPTGAEIRLPSDSGKDSLISVERGSGSALALATTDRRIAFAYVFDHEQRRDLHLAILDERGERLGDIVTLASGVTSSLVPAVAFAGETALVYWSDDSGPVTRLMMATFKPGDTSPSAPKVMLPERLTHASPVTARLPSGQWVLGWVASVGAGTVLRVSALGPGGELAGLTDVAQVSALQLLGATPGERGIALHWVETTAGTSTARVADVTCAQK